MVNLDRVYAKALVDGWEEAMKLAKELPYDVEEDLKAAWRIHQEIKTPDYKKFHRIVVGRYDLCPCYEDYSEPRKGILAPNPYCEICGGTGEVFIPSSEDYDYYMGFRIWRPWPDDVNNLTENSDIDPINIMYDSMHIENYWKGEKSERLIEDRREFVKYYRRFRSEGMSPDEARKEAIRKFAEEKFGNEDDLPF